MFVQVTLRFSFSSRTRSDVNRARQRHNRRPMPNITTDFCKSIDEALPQLASGPFTVSIQHLHGW